MLKSNFRAVFIEVNWRVNSLIGKDILDAVMLQISISSDINSKKSETN